MNFKKQVRKIQRDVNRKIKALNRSIENDELWLGRFYVRQVNRRIYKYEDNSGVGMSLTLIMIDKQTGKNQKFYCFSWDVINTYLLWWALSDFIVKFCKVWEENPSPKRGATVDYRKK